MFLEIMNELNNIDYGYLDINDNIHNQIDEKFLYLYKLQSPNEIIKSKVGVCWDQVELERELFIKNNIKVKSYFIVYYNNKDCPTHTFIICKHNDKYYWFEHAFEKYRGIHVYLSEKEALNDIKNKFISTLNDDIKIDNLCIYEYLKPKYGISVYEFFKHCESGKKVI